MTKSPENLRPKNDDSSISEHRTPKWVKLFGLVILILFFVFVVIHLLGGGFRGHTP